jgi:hypothetical protein
VHTRRDTTDAMFSFRAIMTTRRTTPCPLWAGWTGMLDGTSRPTNPEYEPDGIHQEGGAASPSCDEPDPVTSGLA